MVGRQYRIPYLEKCITLIRESRSVPQALHLIQKLLDSFPDTPTAIEDRTKSSIIQHLQAETGVCLNISRIVMWSHGCNIM